jgi:hypothetical protein
VKICGNRRKFSANKKCKSEDFFAHAKKTLLKFVKSGHPLSMITSSLAAHIYIQKLPQTWTNPQKLSLKTPNS